MRVLYFSAIQFIEKPNGEITSRSASARYRILLPGRILSRLGYQNQLISLGERILQNPRLAAAELKGDIAVVGKFFDPRFVPLFGAMKERGVRIVADFCDNYFIHPTHGAPYKALADTADRIVANSQTMAEEIGRLTKRTTDIVFDPVEGRKYTARFSPSLPRMKFAWYGFPAGLQFLLQRLDEWSRNGLGFPIEVDIVTKLLDEVRAAVATANRLGKDRSFFRLTPWSTEAAWQAIRDCDAVLLPSEINETTKTKSANRVTEAIYGGRLAIASRLPSYLEFANFCSLDDDLRVLDAVRADPTAVERKIAAGQDYIERRYLPFHAALAWDAVFRGTGAPKPVKLNLGCGDNMLPDHINVDSTPMHQGPPPDVFCDLRYLTPFADGCADEIISVHGLERIGRQEAAAALQEWRRALKPGGRIAIELSKAEDGGAVERLLTESGFENVRREAVRSGQRETRIVGEKAAS